MIRYALQCDHGHGFEAWFGDSAAYDDQAARGCERDRVRHGVGHERMARIRQRGR